MELNEQYQSYPDLEPEGELESKQSGSSQDRDITDSAAKSLPSVEVEVVQGDRVLINEFIEPKSTEGNATPVLIDNSGGGG